MSMPQGRWLFFIAMIFFSVGCVEVECPSGDAECIEEYNKSHETEAEVESETEIDAETETEVTNVTEDSDNKESTLLGDSSNNCDSDLTANCDQLENKDPVLIESEPTQQAADDQTVGTIKPPVQVPTPVVNQSNSEVSESSNLTQAPDVTDSINMPDASNIDVELPANNVAVVSAPQVIEDITIPVNVPEIVIDPYYSQAIRIADYILELQNADGAIPDSPNSGISNEDSNMEYALLGLAAAYWKTGDIRYMQGLEQGIRWLAERQDMSLSKWRGSWFYGYQSSPPYQPVPISVGAGITDVRGVDATSTLFVYLLYLQSSLSGSYDLVTLYRENAIAALDFVLNNNSDSNSPFFFSSWQQKNGQWVLWRYQYAADQGDVYLGLESGARLFVGEQGNIYAQAANALKQQINTAFFDVGATRYALGRHPDGSIDFEIGTFNSIFPQGYLPWVFGFSDEALSSLKWMDIYRQADGSISFGTNGKLFSLTNVIFIMAESALYQSQTNTVIGWLLDTTYDPAIGSVRDTANQNSAVFSNVLGFTVVALLGFPSFP